MRIYFKTIFLVILFVSTCSVIAGILPDGPYFGQTPPGFTAEVFGPNIVSLPNRRETKIVFSPDGNECFFAAFPTSSSTILYTKQENGHWLDPVEADFLGVSGAKHEPFISPDGQKFLFTNGDIYMSTKVDGQWSAAVKLPSPVNTSEGDWHPSMASDGTLYFTSNREGIFRIYRSELVDGQYTQVEKLDST